MRRRYTRWIVFYSTVVLLIVSLLACSQPATQPQEIRIAGGPAGGAKALRSEGIAEVIRRANPGWQSRVITGVDSYPALNMLAKGDLEMDIYAVETPMETAKGTYRGQPLEKGPLMLANIAPSHFATAAAVALEKVPVNSIGEIKTKQYGIKIGVGPKDSDFEGRNVRVLEAYGITYADIEKWGGKIIFQGDAAVMDMMRDGLADAFMNFGTHPSPLAQELASSRSLKLLTVSEPDAVKSLEKYGYITTTLKAGFYPFVKSDMTTVIALEAVLARADMKDDVTYKIAKAIWENREYMYGVHPAYKQTLTLEGFKMLDEESQKFGIPIHPGARKYLSEQGILK